MQYPSLHGTVYIAYGILVQALRSTYVIERGPTDDIIASWKSISVRFNKSLEEYKLNRSVVFSNGRHRRESEERFLG